MMTSMLQSQWPNPLAEAVRQLQYLFSSGI